MDYASKEEEGSQKRIDPKWIWGEMTPQKKYIKRRIPMDYNVPLSSMKYATKNEWKPFDVWTRVTLFGLNNMEFNIQVGVIKLLI